MRYSVHVDSPSPLDEVRTGTSTIRCKHRPTDTRWCEGQHAGAGGHARGDEGDDDWMIVVMAGGRSCKDLPDLWSSRIATSALYQNLADLPTQHCVRISRICHLGPVAVSRGRATSALRLANSAPCSFSLAYSAFTFRRSLFLSHLFHIPCSRVLPIPSPLISPPSPRPQSAQFIVNFCSAL